MVVEEEPFRIPVEKWALDRWEEGKPSSSSVSRREEDAPSSESKSRSSEREGKALSCWRRSASSQKRRKREKGCDVLADEEKRGEGEAGWGRSGRRRDARLIRTSISLPSSESSAPRIPIAFPTEVRGTSCIPTEGAKGRWRRESITRVLEEGETRRDETR